MTVVQRAFATCVVLVVILVASHLVVLAAGDSAFPASPNLVERGTVLLAFFGVRYAPYFATAAFLVQTVLIWFWVFRPPRPDANHRLALQSLATWLRWSVLVVALGIIVSLATWRAGLGYGASAVWAMVLFTWSYVSAVYHAIRVRGFPALGDKAFLTPRSVALACVVPPLVMPLWPLGLVIPFWVYRSAKNNSVGES